MSIGEMVDSSAMLYDDEYDGDARESSDSDTELEFILDEVCFTGSSVIIA